MERISDESEFFRKRNLYGKNEKIIVFFSSLLLSILMLLSIALVQNNEYNQYIKSKNSSSPRENSNICKTLVHYDVIRTPISSIILLVFIIMHKRRSFLISICDWKNIGLPMIVSVWKKSDRAYTSLVYGTIAYQVFQLFESLIEETSANKSKITDGINEILNILLKVFLIGIRKPLENVR